MPCSSLWAHARAIGLAAALSMGLAEPVHAADLVVSAAASLTNAFKTIAQQYEAQHPDTKVVLNFGASDVLMQQIARGAPADVFASADQEAMNKAVDEKVIKTETRHDFVANQLVLIVPVVTAAGTVPVHALTDLTKPEVKRVAIGNPASVPVGRYAKRALEGAGLWAPVEAKAVLAQNVRQALDYVSRGEVEAGLVFSTDAAIAADKVKVASPVPLNVPLTYPIAVTSGTKQPQQAADFVAFVMSPAGQAVLAKYGFLKP
ncbi:molybdate ABC transporter substrate-binding protein [Ralstonia insidiosa]|jgi:molybdate transport system substrate-binding protein|uniref:molybdate ABC transporter substrate-binding protein n=1 Tax=Ralstonia TaxID=48736 RepID=UPI000664C25B|nr:molybdate ABC transporter substrate-binding protein [Ralstonia insidiosa]KMW45788.1 molybdate ABC transporter substrate-binding protein [Ralstonia sp. MD27]MBX3771024.1 molybdate ABC transporter substrate-binding protein [Ralstonia pickettii]NOZ17790.1 molybdate ABC transporter substrate-binding protein [Betaproteobacteria bacterium]MBA9855731.1 molybdate ABC transporter substrate-binding protein [Ralstonia insidiosa]MBA9870080.1 molybdate ABC transporter substrate-binding protein [Ralstoni